MRTLFLLLFLVAAPATAAGRKPTPVPEPLSDHLPSTLGSEHDCGPGEADRMWTVNYLEPPGDVYYSLLRSQDCDVCGPGVAVGVVDAAIALEFQVPCAAQAIVSIVAATGDGCRIPDPTTVLCGPVELDLTGPRAGILEFRSPLASCSFSGDAFLRVEFLELPAECASQAERPRLVTSNQCEPCASYNHYPGHEDDLCDLLLPGRPVMYVGTTGCGVVPVAQQTWGSLKVRYRD